MTANVLIVEDDSSLRSALSDTLELAGFGVFATGDGHQGLEIVGR